MKKIFLLAGWILSLPGCMKVKPKESAADPAPSPTAAAAHVPSVTYKIQATEEPNVYHVEFQFEPGLTAAYVTKTFGKIKQSDWIQIKSQVWVDTSIPPNQDIEYEFGSLNQNHFESWQKISLRGPQDLLIDRRITLEDKIFADDFSSEEKQLNLRRYRRLFLNQDGVLETGAHDVTISAEELISAGGAIQTFPAEATAARQAGHAGGQVIIRVDKAQGNLRVEMRGENGAAGEAGTAPGLKNKGIKGDPGSPGKVDDRLYNSGNVGSAGAPICTLTPGQGQKGHTGSRGEAGKNGERGGDGGQFIIFARQSDDFSITPFKSSGHGGRPGPGGAGGAGGDGGDPGAALGATPDLNPCLGKAGETGDQGPPGADGAWGSDGLIGSICEVKSDAPKFCY